MPANRAGRRRPAPRGSHVFLVFAVALAASALLVGLFAGATPAWAHPVMGAASAAPASTLTLSDLTSNGLLIFTTIGCILGVIGLLAIIITSITLVSDGWGPLLKAMIRGNRRGKLRFKNKSRPARGDARRTPQSDPRAAMRDDGRNNARGDARVRPRAAATTARARDGWH